MVETLGRYKLLELIGPCPLGEVYRARDSSVGRTVAITAVDNRVVAEPERRSRFLEATRAAVAVSHPNIVTLYEVGEDEGGLYLVHEFIQGQTLSSIIAGRALNARRAVNLASQIAEGLSDAHAADLVHGHITGDTILVTPKGGAKITGFGLAGWSTSAAGSPENSTPNPAVDYRADLSSLGVLLFEMLTGRLPATGASVPSAVNRSLPRELDPIVARALGLSGGYESAVTLAAELRAVGALLEVRQETKEVASASMATGRRKKAPRQRRIALAVAVAVLTLLAVAALAMALGYFVRPA